MKLDENYGTPAQVHGFQKVNGILALDLNKILTEEELSAGDRISWFSLPDEKFFVSKDPEGIPIKRISSAYIYLDAEIKVEEQ